MIFKYANALLVNKNYNNTIKTNFHLKINKTKEKDI